MMILGIETRHGENRRVSSTFTEIIHLGLGLLMKWLIFFLGTLTVGLLLRLEDRTCRKDRTRQGRSKADKARNNKKRQDEENTRQD